MDSTRSQLTLLVIAVSVVATGVLLPRQVRITSLKKSGRAPTQFNPVAPQDAEPANRKSGKDSRDEFPVTDSFELPFLGKIKGHARAETLHIESESGNAVDVPLKVFYSPEGIFLHALYAKPGAVDYTNTVETIQSAYTQREQRIIGLPAKNARVSFGEVLTKFAKSMPENFDFKAAVRVDVSYVLWQRQAENQRPLYIINVYGCEKIADHLPNETRFKRIRYLVNDEGEMLVMDNLL